MRRTAAVLAFALALLIARSVMLSQWSWQIHNDLVLLLAIPLIFSLAIGFKPKELGLQFGASAKALLPTALILLASAPLIFAASRLPDFYNYYPLFPWAKASIAGFIGYELFILALMASTEFFFRGFLMLGTRHKLGGAGSNLLQVIPYVALHLGKPWLELPASFFGGLIFGWLDQRSKSILPSVALHFFFNLLMDLFCLQAAGALIF